MTVRSHSRVVSKGLTLQQISVLTSDHYDAVTGWVKAGLLPAVQLVGEHGSPWVVELKDLVGFLLTYSPLASLAGATGSSSRGLVAKPQTMGVSVIARAGPRGALVKVSDLIVSQREAGNGKRHQNATAFSAVEGVEGNAIARSGDIGFPSSAEPTCDPTLEQRGTPHEPFDHVHRDTGSTQR